MGDVGAPQAPWELTGECVLAVARRRGAGLGPVPSGWQPVPGLVGLAAANFHGSPVGPYLEFAVAEPVRAGCRMTLCVTTMVVDSPESRVAGRLNWGLPKELGRLAWTGTGHERCLVWEDRNLEMRATTRKGPSVPVVVPVRARQQRGEETVVVPGRLRGWARLADVELSVPDADPLAPLVGHHLGLHVAGACLVMGPARAADGRARSFRALRTAPEPALSLRSNHRGD